VTQQGTPGQSEAFSGWLDRFEKLYGGISRPHRPFGDRHRVKRYLLGLLYAVKHKSGAHERLAARGSHNRNSSSERTGRPDRSGLGCRSYPREDLRE
jgi:hypothetical protein